MLFSDHAITDTTDISNSQFSIPRVQTDTTGLICCYPWLTGVPLAKNRTEYLQSHLDPHAHPEELTNMILVRYKFCFSTTYTH
jgi:hypothetical protein